MTDSSDVIFEEVRSVISSTLPVSIDQITRSTKIADLSQDSIQLFELLLAFEKRYATETTYEDVVRLQTVEDVVIYVQKKVHEKK